ncbi:MAG: TonB family protein, partial [Spirosoma sp.]|nr:TonB family protein [Spirosoma sp.]
MAEIANTATLDDIVFANRNQEYGAYSLRKGYPKTVTRALIIGGI